MDAKMINHAFLHNLTVEVWQAGELTGTGRITEHTKDYIRLDDEDFFSKASCEIKIAREPKPPG
ncbi:hypothetical protein J4772_11590 [Cohnella sp. LGH]|uniref:hypothetical protein n=1 Tax=Cohnella sp. LGH TaxID=1619153 RepID=UPI001ADC333B|nr:hypothetical protein [Cohnella sp. LGH]QTH44981.1 hypothetical protein J4772_11590 [Cohnella sp. LGH]